MTNINELRQRLAGVRDAKEPVPKRIRGFGDPLIESDVDFKSRERQSDYMNIWKGTWSGSDKERIEYKERKEGWGDASGKWERERADETMDIQPNQPQVTGVVRIKGMYKKPQNREFYDSGHTDVAPRKPFGVGPLNRPITRSQTETPLLKEVPFGSMLKHSDKRRKEKRYRIGEPAVPDLLSKRDPNPFRIRPRKPTQAERSEIITAKLRQRIARIYES